MLALLYVLSACSSHGPSSTYVPGTPEQSLDETSPISALNPTVQITQFSLKQYTGYIPGAGSVLGGATSSDSGDVYVTMDYDIVHIKPTGASNRLHLENQSYNGRFLFGGIAWKTNVIWYLAEMGEEPALWETNASGVDLSDSGCCIGKYGDLGYNAAVGPDSKIWFARCENSDPDTCGSTSPPTGGTIDSYKPGDTVVNQYSLGKYVGNTVAAGPDGHLYVTDTSAFSTASGVARVSTLGVVTNQFALPAGSIPSNLNNGADSGIATGADHYLWIVENGTNQIARMSTTGIVKQFHIPTPNADARNIASGQDGAMWFTEFGANKIGRITTAGYITEYRIPTAHAGADGIVSCRIYGCPLSSHGYVWFVEKSVNAVGRIQF